MNNQITNQLKKNINNTIALLLWENGAIKVNNDQPFKLASGNYSPIYINCRQVISDPVFMHLFTSFAHTILHRSGLKIDMIAGGETAGIPFGSYVAQSMSLPFVYVRKAKKGYGIANLVEGGSVDGKHVLLVEDLITDAGSKLHFIEALRAGGVTVEDVLVLFDRNQGGQEALLIEGINLLAVTNLTISLEVAGEMELITEEDLKSVNDYLMDPQDWHKSQGLKFS
ncbi:MAG: orotate phosphoribosyltransferase [Candidatus Hatepunaea meridiana]|nr:orotate phosphoribosyltransferase [Candidatus Hatepunaea meridiana]